MTPIVDVVFFAIQAALRLYGATRKAYADATLDRELIFPLPKGGSINADSARQWFVGDDIGQAVRTRLHNPRIEHFLSEEINDLTPGEAAEFVEIYTALYDVNAVGDSGRGDRAGSTMTTEELDKVLTVVFKNCCCLILID
jgi:hypothetical protein